MPVVKNRNIIATGIRREVMFDPKLYPGTKHCKCTACGEYFTTVFNFDLHRAGDWPKRVCTYPGELVSKAGKAKLRRNGRGLWARTGGVFIPQKTDA